MSSIYKQKEINKVTKYLAATFLGTIVMFFVGCSPQSSKIEENKTYNLVYYLDNFIDKYPNWDQNNIITDKINDSLKFELSTELNRGLLDSLPINLSEINEFEKGKFAVNLDHWTNNYYKSNKGNSYKINFNIIGVIPDSLVNTLVNKNKYYIKGEFVEFLKGDYKTYINGSVYTPLIGLKKEFGSIEVDMGIMLFNINDMQAVK